MAVEELRASGGRCERRMLVEAADEREELSAAARWVRGLLEERPRREVAVIVPGLETQRSGDRSRVS